MTNFSKFVTDPVHDQMRVDGVCWAFIDTTQFQRLRDLKQLGSAYFVFPGAAHNRFEHSLGVAHLAGELVRHLRDEQPDLEIDAIDVKCVTLAGLTHDLGHGPFSHIFDSHVIPRLRPDKFWSHEIASEAMLEHLVTENGLTDEQCSDEELKFIKSLIRGSEDISSSQSHKQSRRSGKMFLFDIVNNKRNSVDVDKFDYIARDSMYLGVETKFNHMRSIKFSRVIDDQICWNSNHAFDICRFTLTSSVTGVGKAIELMLTDALCLADPFLQFSTAIDSPEEYTYLTDAILKEIERSRAPELKASQKILKRIRDRDLYRLADAYLLPVVMFDRVTKKNFTVAKVLEFADASERKRLNEDFIHAEYLALDWCFGTENPIDRCGFFTKYEPNCKINLNRSSISHLIPTNPREVSLRIFVKDESIRTLVQKIFRRFIAELGRVYPTTVTATVLSQDIVNGNNLNLDFNTSNNGNYNSNKSLRVDQQFHPLPSATHILSDMAKNTGFDDDDSFAAEEQFSTPVKRNRDYTGENNSDFWNPGNNVVKEDRPLVIHNNLSISISEHNHSDSVKHSNNDDGNGSKWIEGISDGNNLPQNYNEAFRKQSPQKKRTIH
ncbi:SAM domain and HD [Physocladia obscura]|uniref:SAM domain and HD n=1 Tax=Physocladia obscura TaxID=109957 RepID=A0AAD5T6Q4_9FUNG|nr:SAM domain and HD [Physocladia obscura]